MNEYDYLFKFIIIGNTGVGKSCILSQFIDGRFKKEHDATIGVEFGSKNIEVDGRSIKIQIWDTAGQEQFRSITRSYFRGSVGALIVYDVTKKESFEGLSQWLNDVHQNSNKQLSVMVVGNKTDLEIAREIKRKEGESFASEKNFLFEETSAFSGKNIKDIFTSLAADVLKRIQNGEIDLTDTSSGVKVGQKSNKQKNLFKEDQSNSGSTTGEFKKTNIELEKSSGQQLQGGQQCKC